ncbi:MAG: NAD(P)H-dependent oxidoreductase [Oligoflexia bacterium]|nr:NAD(P)H-dependent oxidoreductase [Oligoflexia bacterium]
MAKANIVGVCGSLRQNSLNREILRLGLDMVKAKGHEAELLDLRSFSLPLFNEDIAGSGTLPENVSLLKNKVRSASGLIIASPEYNASISSSLKNAIDWIFVNDNPFKYKVIGLIGVSTVWWGASRSLSHARSIFSHMGSYVVPSQLALPFAAQNFLNGKLSKEYQDTLANVVDELIMLSTKLER